MMLLLLWCGLGGLVGALIGAMKGRVLAGLFLGTFLNLLGWVMIIEAPTRHHSPSPALSPSE